MECSAVPARGTKQIAVALLVRERLVSRAAECKVFGALIVPTLLVTVSNGFQILELFGVTAANLQQSRR